MVKPKKFVRRRPDGLFSNPKPPGGGAKKGGKAALLNKAQKAKITQHQAPSRPAEAIDPFDRILLVGEGDFSFAASLVEHFGCAEVTATAFDSEEEVLAKYPTVPAALATLQETEQTVLYSIDATKLGKLKGIKKRAPFDRIVFNFPHVGGKTKDVLRQVRYNQELLQAFFHGAKPLLSTSPNVDSGRVSPGAIYVTIFDQAPYTTEWNVKRLAQDAGLILVRSEQFNFSTFPGYTHARTLGALTSKKDKADNKTDADDDDGVMEDDEEDAEKVEEESGSEEAQAGQVKTGSGSGTGAGWKGEDRKARTFIFEVAPEKQVRSKRKPIPKGKGKGGFEEISSDED